MTSVQHADRLRVLVSQACARRDRFRKTGERLIIPIHPELRRALKAHRRKHHLIIATAFGKPLSRDVLNIHSDLDPCRCGAARATVGLIQFGRKFNVSNTTLQLLGDHVLARHPARPAAPRNALELLRITSLNWLTNSSVELIELEKMTGLRSHASLAGVAKLKTLRHNHRYRHSLTAAI